METGALTSYFDVGALSIWTFWLFFAGLIYYLRREDRREGYPLVRYPSDRASRPASGADIIPWIPETKTFALTHGGTARSGQPERSEPAMTRTAAFPGAPFEPVGDPMQSGVGPGAYAQREDKPELTFEGEPMIVPLRVATDFHLDEEDPDPRGMAVVGADAKVAGQVAEIWVDRAEPQVRYYEVELPAPAAPRRRARTEEGGEEAPPAPAAPRVLLPIYFTELFAAGRQIRTDSILASQFANVPRLKNPDQVTKLEEEKITAYYAAGKLYAEPRRVEPLL